MLEDFGIEGDAHAGSQRQVSLLPFESFDKVKNDVLEIYPGDFAENLTITGFDFESAKIGKRISIGNEIILEITDIGKECHNDCPIKMAVGDCIMPREGVFARVIKGGNIKIGDSIGWK
jgi:MOSC domain-containing protein YiiM